MNEVAPSSDLSRAQWREETRKAVRFSASLTPTYAVMNLLRRLPSSPNGTAVSLLVRRIGVEEMTHSGPVFESAGSSGGRD
jgi:hypothetical protein